MTSEDLEYSHIDQFYNFVLFTFWLNYPSWLGFRCVCLHSVNFSQKLFFGLGRGYGQ